MNISNKQNQSENLKLLVAQATLYHRAKVLQNIRTIGSMGLATISPFILLLWPSMISVMASLGGVWLLASKLIIEEIEKIYSKKAAIIQEEFDTNVFELPWNSYIVANMISPEIVATLQSQSKQEQSCLKDWYSNTDQIQYPGNILFCQRMNLVWDWRLRKQYSMFVIVATSFIFIIGVVISLITQQTLLDYLLAILMPSLSALIKGVEISKKHFEIAKKKEDLSIKILDLLKKFQYGNAKVDVGTCRMLQDVIYIHRSACPIIPDWWYRRFKDEFQISVNEAAEYLTLNK